MRVLKTQYYQNLIHLTNIYLVLAMSIHCPRSWGYRSQQNKQNLLMGMGGGLGLGVTASIENWLTTEQGPVFISNVNAFGGSYLFQIIIYYKSIVYLCYLCLDCSCPWARISHSQG